MLSNTFMNLMIGMSNLLADSNIKNAADADWLTKFTNVIFDILAYALVIVAAAGTIYAIVLGVNMARADSADKREEAKQRVLYTIIGIVICVVLIILFFILSENLPTWINNAQNSQQNPDDTTTMIKLLSLR